MSALADAPPAVRTQNPSARLRTMMAAVRLSFTWFGVRKSLTPAQKALAAESFGAEGEFLSAGKKLLDTKHPAFRAVTAIRGRVQSVWRGIDCPCCGGTVIVAWNRADELPEFAECRRCETAFPYAEREVYEIDLLDVTVPEPLAYVPAAA